MSRRFIALLSFAVFSPGCVPVTEPVGDIDKAEVDKRLVGEWATAKNPEEVWKIEVAPEVKGNPKGLMRAKIDSPWGWMYFSLVTVGEQRYGNAFGGVADKDYFADLGKEGAYEKWTKNANRHYDVFLVESHNDGITCNWGDEDVFKTMMAKEKIEKEKIGEYQNLFRTPAGWLTKYLDKNGRDKLFPVAKDEKFVKVKK